MSKNKEGLHSSVPVISPELQAQYEDIRVVEFEHGSVGYSVIGESNPNHNSIIVIGGMDNGRINLLAQASLLAKKGNTQVLITDQPKYDEDTKASFKRNPDNALDFLANATISAAEDAGLIGEDKVANMTGHSLGGLVGDRIRKIAEEKKIQSLLPENGSLFALLGSSGLNPRENWAKLGQHWLKYGTKGLIEAKVLDPTGENGKTIIKNALADPAKTTGEIRALAEKRISPSLEGAIALVYPEDHMFPVNDKRIARAVEHGQIPFITPIDPISTSIKGLDRWMTINNLKRRRARLNYALSHRGAGHDDPANNPERTADVVLDFFYNN
jgi:hypothetical protein